MKRIGIVFGCFIPLHTGHVSLIDKALQENDTVVIAVCGKDNDRGKDFIPFRDRVTIVSEKYKQVNKVRVISVDDNAIGMDGSFSLSNWRIWCAELFKNAGLDPYDTRTIYTWYLGEKDYKSKIQIVHPSHCFSLADRSLNTVSGTKIREDVNMYRDQIDPEFQNYLKEKGMLK